MNSTPKTQRIAQLNDMARKAMGVTSRVMQTPGVRALPAPVQSRVREAVERFDAFTPDNDPHGERDFGAVEVEGAERVFWKIDYYDKACEYGSDDPSNAGQTTRVLTIMLASEYDMPQTINLTPSADQYERVAQTFLRSLASDLSAATDQDGNSRRDEALLVLGEALTLVAYLATLPDGAERVERLKQFAGQL